MKSILKDVVYLNIVTSGLNPNTSEIIFLNLHTLKFIICACYVVWF